MSFIGARPPKANIVKKFGEDTLTYKLYGRTHLDYLDLFKKFAQDIKYPSYALGFIGEAEVGVPKITFDGHFEDFYNNEFSKFAVYNVRDTDILVKLNKKRKLIELVNTIAHESTCLFENLLGTVRYVETAIINRAHKIHNLIVRDKPNVDIYGVVDGALVLDPLAGLWEWLGSVDINSLYPSVIRSLNISPEMIIGQFISGTCNDQIKKSGSRFVSLRNDNLPEWQQALVAVNIKKLKNRNDLSDEDEIYSDHVSPGEYDWAGIIENDNNAHVLCLSEIGKKILNTCETHLEFTGKEWIDIFNSQKWAISAYGTVFDQSRGLGIIPAALEAWYIERKALQSEKKKYEFELKSLQDDIISITPELQNELILAGLH
jgi:DNA polymerase elongation subunit (family B)